jgi:hypothetical protein
MCGMGYTPGKPSLAQQPDATFGQKCQQCGYGMERAKRSEHNMPLQALGVAIFIVGICLLFVFPIGTVIGVILIIVATRLGYSEKKVWKCGNCGYFFERA